MLEALAAGLPVVASDLPEMREILGDCGVLIRDPTARNYASALDALVSNEQTIEHLRTLSVQKARCYTWKDVLDATEAVYQEVLCAV